MFHLNINWLCSYDYDCLCKKWKRDESKGAQGMEHDWETMFFYSQIRRIKLFKWCNVKKRNHLKLRLDDCNKGRLESTKKNYVFLSQIFLFCIYKKNKN